MASNTAVRTGDPATDRAVVASIRDAETLPQLFVARVAMAPAGVAFRQRGASGWFGTTWHQYGEAVEHLTLALEERGVAPGDRVAILGGNRPEWLAAGVATESLGGTVVGVYPTSSPEELSHLVADSGAVVLVVDGAAQLAKAVAVRSQMPTLRWIVTMDDGIGDDTVDGWLSLPSLLERGTELARQTPDRFGELVAAVRPDDIASIVYTSGTTGPPKGAMFSQRAALAAGRVFATAVGYEPGDTLVSYLPLCHIAERTLSIYVHLLVGTVPHFAESVMTAGRDITEVEPTFYGPVPRMAEKHRDAIESAAAAGSALGRVRHRAAMAMGHAVARRRIGTSGNLPAPWRLVAGVADRVGLAAARRSVGLGNVTRALIGAAAVQPELMAYFHALGIRMVQLFGQTECGGLSHMHRGWDIRFDTVGQPVEGCDFKIDAESSEILLRCPGTFVGYWGQQDATASTLVDGWLRTGDLGAVDADGHLRIVGRMKDIIITSGGKNISPQLIENQLRLQPHIAEAIVVGEARPYLGALILIDLEAVGPWAAERGIAGQDLASLATDPDVRTLIDHEVQEVNAKLAQVETIKRFTLLDRPLSQADGDLTATQKVRRSAILSSRAAVVDALYA